MSTSKKEVIFVQKLTFFEDKEFKYNDGIVNGLKKFNISQTGFREKDSQSFYVFDNEELVGGARTKMESDWAFIKTIYYKNFDILKNLINDIKKYYKDKVVGIQFNSVISDRVEDFKSLGFIEKGKLEDMPIGKENVFLINTNFDIHEVEEDYETKKTDEPIKEYDTTFKKKLDKLRKSLNFSNEVIDIQFVALDNEKFAGGIYGNFQNDYLFINILFVNNEYRGKKIATKLMKMIENRAYEMNVHNLYITTFEFQALGLYKRLGYEVVMEIYDYPKGFKEYTVYKKLDK